MVPWSSSLVSASLCGRAAFPLFIKAILFFFHSYSLLLLYVLKVLFSSGRPSLHDRDITTRVQHYTFPPKLYARVSLRSHVPRLLPVLALLLERVLGHVALETVLAVALLNPEWDFFISFFMFCFFYTIALWKYLKYQRVQITSFFGGGGSKCLLVLNERPASQQRCSSLKKKKLKTQTPTLRLCPDYI